MQFCLLPALLIVAALPAEGSSAGLAAANPPRVFLLDGPGLAAVREGIAAGEATVQAPYAALLDEASRALEFAPVSVMDKERVPPSGDKHDYMSLGSYWWPNPETENGLPYVRHDGKPNPEGDALDRRRLQAMATHVETLALAGYLSGNEIFARHAATLLRVWFLDEATRMNPHLRYGQGIPGICEGRDIGIIDTAVLTRVVDSAGLLADTAAWTRAEEEGLMAWFRAYLEWLLTSDYGQSEARQPNNHGTWYDIQAASFAYFTGQDEVAREVLVRSGDRRIATQIEPDGKQPLELARTKSWGYSCMNLNAFFNLAHLGSRAGVDLWSFRGEASGSIRDALDFLAGYAEGEPPWPYAEIGGMSSVPLHVLLRRGARVYNNPEYEALLTRLRGDEQAADRFDLLWPAQRSAGQ